MELYKKEKVNPMGGCLPVLITLPGWVTHHIDREGEAKPKAA
ncbi:Membrane protein insertase YidC [Rhodanobacter lindaniclasticus]